MIERFISIQTKLILDINSIEMMSRNHTLLNLPSHQINYPTITILITI